MHPIKEELQEYHEEPISEVYTAKVKSSIFSLTWKTLTEISTNQIYTVGLLLQCNNIIINKLVSISLA
jgi:hypothetical protein